MKIFRPGLPTLFIDEPEPQPEKAAPDALPSIEAAMALALQRSGQVLEYTRKPGDQQPLIVNPQPGTLVPHSINDKPEVAK
jgi:hypothetical protein